LKAAGVDDLGPEDAMGPGMDPEAQPEEEGPANEEPLLPKKKEREIDSSIPLA
jgi:hypothetical protein